MQGFCRDPSLSLLLSLPVPGLFTPALTMSEDDGGATSAPGSSTQNEKFCGYCHKSYNGKKTSKFCSKPCFNNNRLDNPKSAPNPLIQALSQVLPATNAEKEVFVTPRNNSSSKRLLSASNSPDVDDTVAKKLRYSDITSFTEDPDLHDLSSLSRDDITAKLSTALSLIREQQTHIKSLSDELVDVKLAFADFMTFRFTSERSSKASPNTSDVTSQASCSMEAGCSNKPSFAQITRSQQASVLVASYANKDASTERLTLEKMEKLLASDAGGPVPASVRQKDNNVYVRLTNPADLSRAKAILETTEGTNSSTLFNSVSQSTKLFPAVALFVDLSLLPRFKAELELRNCDLSGKIDSITQIYSKPNSNRGHIKILFNCKSTRDAVLMGGELDCFNTSCRVVEVLLDKEVRRCFNCQGYGHMQSSCRATKATCGKCAGTHRTRDCKSLTWKCANCQGDHQAGDRFCKVQMQAVARYRQKLEKF